MLDWSLISLGFIVFLVGYFFLAQSQGEAACNSKDQDAHYKGGIAGVVIGIIFMIIGFILKATGSTGQVTQAIRTRLPTMPQYQ